MLSCILAGCKSEKVTENNTNYNVTSKPSPTEAAPTKAAPTEAAPTEATPTETAAESDPKVEDHQRLIDPDTSNTYYGPDPDLKDFTQLSNYFKDYDFTITSDINHKKFISTYEILSEYDLNGDGINESIEGVLSNDNKVDSYVKVNDIRIDLYTDNPSGEVKIIDLDSNDNYLAHEIGHICLHVNEELNMFIDNDFIDSDEYETEANYFAACLLMPDDKVVKYISLEMFDKSIDRWTALDIAKIMTSFNVSFDMAINGLENLGKINGMTRSRLESEKSM